MSSGLTGDSDDAVAMVTGICPDPDDVLQFQTRAGLMMHLLTEM